MNRLFTNALSALSLVAIISPSFALDNVTSKTHSTRIDQLNHIREGQKINHNRQVAIDKIAIVSPSVAQDSQTSKTNITKIDYINNQLVALKSNPVTTKQTAPFNLVRIGYQGFLEAQGIPSGGAFLRSINHGDITAKILVQSGIDNGRLSPQTLNDQGYLYAVQTQLNGLNRN